jgi:hypothetical protein
MERRREHLHQLDHFGFDPAPQATHTKHQTKEKKSTCDSSAPDVRNLTREVATGLSFDEHESHDAPGSRHCNDNSLKSPLKLPDKENTEKKNNFWGFDPAIDQIQRSVALEEERSEHKDNNEKTTGKQE